MGMRNALGLMTAMMLAAANNPLFDTGFRSMSEEDKERIRQSHKDYVHQTSPAQRELHEYTVEGKKVMAYSKKDALKRFGNKKSKKHKK